jgi:hypothetical protein
VLDRAWDAEVGRWNKRPTSATDSEHGSDWWIYAEADQLLSTLDLAGATLESSRTQALRHWLADYVDTTSPSREIIPGIRRDGAWAYPWRAADTAKCNQWKSSFHSTEHALVNALVGDWRTGTATALHFAVPEAQSATFIARPYLFEGRETARERAAPLQVGDLSLRPVTVRFVELW